MLTFRIKSGDYITIGENVVVQIFERPRSNFEVSIKAPREVPIFRSEIYERTENRPDGIKEKRIPSPSERKRNAMRRQKVS